MISEQQQTLLAEFVDYLLPEMTSYEAVIYLYLLRHSHFANQSPELRIGQKRLAAGLGIGIRAAKTNQRHIRKTLLALKKKGCIRSGNTTREGTWYHLLLPRDIPTIAAKLASLMQDDTDDWYSDPAKRAVIFERDGWRCQYCGEVVDAKTATLDHYVPQCKSGAGTRDNLRTSCLLCNSFKSGKSYEAAAPLLLRSIQKRRARSADTDA